LSQSQSLAAPGDRLNDDDKGGGRENLKSISRASVKKSRLLQQQMCPIRGGECTQQGADSRKKKKKKKKE
jgi:hypothetical protein